LKGEARREFRRASKLFAGMGTLTEADFPMFELYCEAWGRCCEMRKKVEEIGPVVQVDHRLKYNPYVLLAEKAFKDFRLMAGEFGASPSARSRVTAVGTEIENEFDAYLRSGRRSPGQGADDADDDEPAMQ
jgi:P27 family predicted phage terminase small subunit